MTGGPLSPLDPPVLDRATLERVLARASELQAAVGDHPEALSEAQLLDVGREVGIASEHLRQALAEERGRGLLPTQSGLAVRFAGVSAVAAARVVPGTPASVLAALDATMQSDEVLVLKRRFPEGLAWEAQRGFIGGLRRGFALNGRGYDLSSATDVAASVAAIDGARVHVRLTARFLDLRSRRLGLAVAATVGLLILAAPLLAIGVAPLLAFAPWFFFGSAAILVIRRQYRRLLARAVVALEQVLDRIEYGSGNASPARAFLDAISGPPRPPR